MPRRRKAPDGRGDPDVAATVRRVVKPDTSRARVLAFVGAARCPDCGGVLDVVTDGLIGKQYAPAFHVRGRPLPYALVCAPFAACSACEFCMEIRP